jgi:PAS domain S-box-containing protein
MTQMGIQPATQAQRPDSALARAAFRMRAVRGRARQFWQMFNRSLVPMVVVDNQRHHLAANAAARLLLRLTREELCARRIEDLTPAHLLGTMYERWAELLRTGRVSGFHEVRCPDGSLIRTVYCARANALPGQHLIVLAPADWPGNELEDADDHDLGTLAGSLSPREREVLELIAAGCGSRQIAEELTISPLTAKTHVEHLLRKLGARNRAHAIALAMRGGLLDLPPRLESGAPPAPRARAHESACSGRAH